MKIYCPKCDDEIPPEDVDVPADSAFCRLCNESFAVSEVVDEETPPEPAIDLSQPPSGAWYEATVDGVIVGATTRTWAAFFLVPFMLVWSGGSLGSIYGKQLLSGKFDSKASLFGIPFLIGTLFIGSLTAMFTFGKVVLTISDDEAAIFTGVGSIGFRKRFKLSEASRVYEEITEGSKGKKIKSIVVEGKTRITFGSMLSDTGRYFMLQVLRKLVAKG